MKLALSSAHLGGIIITLAGVILVGVYAGRKVKSAGDFSHGGRQAGASVVAGTILGTIIGGSSTIGTAQLAFKYGLCAWWFTLGSGIGCAVFGLFLVRRLREAPLQTVPQYLVLKYGSSAGLISCFSATAGSFLGIMAQGVAGVALLTAMFNISPVLAAGICVFLVLGFVFFGGVWSAGLVGVAKSSLLYLATIAGGVLAYSMAGGWGGLTAVFPYHPWFSFFGRSFNQDFAVGLSTMLGVLTGQTYIQAVLSGKNLAEARRGTLISAFLIPPIGIGGILAGLFMRANFPNTPSDQVMPLFIINYLPPVLAGVILATLLITVIGTWSGVALGMTTILTQDIYVRFINPGASDRKVLKMQRMLILILSALSVPVIAGNASSLIMEWAALSMGLQACTVLFPILGSMFFPRLVTPLAGTLATLLGLLVVITWFIMFPGGIAPVYPGLTVSLLALLLVSYFNRGVLPVEGKSV